MARNGPGQRQKPGASSGFSVGGRNPSYLDHLPQATSKAGAEVKQPGHELGDASIAGGSFIQYATVPAA